MSGARPKLRRVSEEDDDHDRSSQNSSHGSEQRSPQQRSPQNPPLPRSPANNSPHASPSNSPLHGSPQKSPRRLSTGSEELPAVHNSPSKSSPTKPTQAKPKVRRVSFNQEMHMRMLTYATSPEGQTAPQEVAIRLEDNLNAPQNTTTGSIRATAEDEPIAEDRNTTHAREDDGSASTEQKENNAAAGPQSVVDHPTESPQQESSRQMDSSENKYKKSRLSPKKSGKKEKGSLHLALQEEARKKDRDSRDKNGPSSQSSASGSAVSGNKTNSRGGHRADATDDSKMRQRQRSDTAAPAITSRTLVRSRHSESTAPGTRTRHPAGGRSSVHTSSETLPSLPWGQNPDLDIPDVAPGATAAYAWSQMGRHVQQCFFNTCILLTFCAIFAALGYMYPDYKVYNTLVWVFAVASMVYPACKIGYYRLPVETRARLERWREDPEETRHLMAGHGRH